MMRRVLKFVGMIVLLTLGGVLQAAKIGLIGRLPAGRGEVLQAAQLAVHAVARKGGGIRIEALDDKGTTAGAMAAAGVLAKDPNVGVVVLQGEEAACLGVQEILAAVHLPAVAADSWAASRPVTGTAVKVWLCPSGAVMSELAAQYCVKKLRLREAATVDDGSATGEVMTASFAAAFRKCGGFVGYQGSWEGFSWGLTRTVGELGAHWPQVVFHVGPPVLAGRLAKAVKRSSKMGFLLGGPGVLDAAFFKEAGVAAKGTIVFLPAPPFEMVRRQRFGVDARKAYAGFGAAGHPGPLVFDATALACQALMEAPGRDAAWQCMGKVGEIAGIQGIGKIENGQPSNPKIALLTLWTRVNSRKLSFLGRAWGPPWAR